MIAPATELVLLDGVLNFAGYHNGGRLRVGPDGYVYAGVGDGGCDYAGDSGGAGANDASRFGRRRTSFNSSTVSADTRTIPLDEA